MADTPDLGSGASAWGFKSPLPHSYSRTHSLSLHFHLFLLALVIFTGCSQSTIIHAPVQDPSRLSWVDWISLHDQKFRAFLNDSQPSIRNYLQSYRLQDDAQEPLSLKNGTMRFERQPGDRLPRLVFYNERSTTATDTILLDSVPDGFEPEGLRLNNAEDTLAALFKREGDKLFCLFKRKTSHSQCNESSWYDIVWGNNETILASHKLDYWRVIAFNTLTGKEETLYQSSEKDGFVLFKKNIDGIAIHETASDRWHLISYSSGHALLKPIDKPIEVDKGCKGDFNEFILASDGTHIPLRLRGDTQKAPAAILLRFYGAYGTPLSELPSKYSNPLVKNGILIADVAIRGGGECGEAWEHAGSGTSKGVGVEDLKATIHGLNIRYPSTPLFLMTRSAGGIPAAIALHEEEPHIRGAILEAPFVALSQWRNAPNAQDEYAMWGDPRTPQGAASLKMLEKRMEKTSVPLFIWIGGKDTVVPIDWIRPWIDGKALHPLIRLDADATHDGPIDTAQTTTFYAEAYAFIQSLL